MSKTKNRIKVKKTIYSEVFKQLVLVNLKHIVAYEKTDGGILQLSNGDKVPISRRRKEDVQKMLKVK